MLALRLEPIITFALLLFLFLLGVHLFRAGAFSADERGRALRRRLLWFGLGIGLSVNLASTLVGPELFLLDRYVFAPMVALGYLGLVGWIVDQVRETGPISTGLASLGRTALSGYVLQNVLCVVVCYGWGLGLASTLDEARPWWVLAIWPTNGPDDCDGRADATGDLGWRRQSSLSERDVAMAGRPRRTVLAMFAGAAASGPYLLLGDADIAVAAASTAADVYPSNTALYADHSLVPGTDYARRHRRHEVLDDDLAQNPVFPQTTILAPHGGGIEVGTSELCLAVAGYHPADLQVTPAGGRTYDYWMFEGLRSSNNDELHVTSTRCDDPVARSLCAGARQTVALHGCTPAQAGLPAGTEAVLVGGLDLGLKALLIEEYGSAGIQAIDAVDHESLNGNHPDNIANRTLRGKGAQLELTTPMRTAMFGTNTRAQRRHTTRPAFWSFVTATRTAIARHEATQLMR
ncbi:poly-gamma-glutamate hydrolase family protein [Micromonospora sp. NPDC003197]